MPRKSCTVCGGPALPGKTRCGLHPRAATPNQKRGYRGLAAYREMRAYVIDRDGGTCGVCGKQGADELGHRIAYSRLDPQTRDDPTTWNADDFVAVHADCNKRQGTSPLGGRTR